MPTPDQKPPERARPIPDELLQRFDRHRHVPAAHDDHAAALGALQSEIRQLRAEVAELRRAIVPGSSPLILGAEAAAEFRRITTTRSPK